jgi:hypothetical protein
MSTFLYYAAQSFAPAIEKHLASRLECGAHHQDVLAGPDKSRGTLFAARDRIEPAKVKYRAGEQDWHLVDAAGRPAYWVGTIEGEEPGPGDLVRTKTLPGHGMELSDGRTWLCPVARGQAAEDGRLVWYHALPRTIVLAPESDRQWEQGPVVPRYQRLWQLAAAYWQAVVAVADEQVAPHDRIEFDFQGAAAAAVDCLAANYRVTAVEVSLLGLLDTAAPRRVLDALIDWPTLVRLSAEMQKKTTSTASAG